jgi:circadian clock protein KaiC
MLIRLLGHLKTHQITGVFTSLAISGLSPEETETGISSLMDTWLILRPAAALPNSARALRVLKSRGMGHDTASRELLLGGTGIFVGEPLEPSSGAFAQERR